MKSIASTLLLLLALSVHLTGANLPSGFIETRLATNLDPTDISIAPDGRLFICEKYGKISIIKNGTLLGTAFLQLQNVDTYNERGLQSLVFDPDFSTDPYIYVYYTTTVGGVHNRISRFTANGDVSSVTSEVVLLDLENLGGGVHNGGQLIFGVDKTLFIATGENGNTSLAQNFTSLLGKILRINKDGSIPVDNPFYGNLPNIHRTIYALGIRNPFKGGIQPGTGKIYFNDVGGSSREEINELQAGKNYGWPNIEGKRVSQTAPISYLDPVADYDHGQGCSITAGTFYNPTTTAFPTSLIGKYFYADYCNGYIRFIDPANPNSYAGFATNINRPIDVEIDNSNGSLYYLARGGLGGGSDQDNTSSSNGELWKVDYNGATNVSISVHPQSKSVSEGSNVQFTVSANGSQPIFYQWQKNNVNINGATTIGLNLQNIPYSDNGATYKAVIRNATSTITSNIATLTVIPNLLPNATITSPISGTTYQGGTVISFSGIATDAEDGILAANRFFWKIDFHHDTHTHPAMDEISGIKNGVYSIPGVGETASNVWLRIYLTVRDSKGGSKTIYQDIFPYTVSITLNTSPTGLPLKLDGSEVTTPYTFTGVSGIIRSIEPILSQVKNNANYSFTGWAHGGENLQAIITPATDTVFVANFNIITVSGTTTGINDRTDHKEITIYPNPSDDKLYISGSEINLYQIFDLTGSLLVYGTYAGVISVGMLPKGSYIIHFTTNDKHYYRKLIFKQ